ncbi:MAG: hypothetical protein V3V71_02105, partial [Roseateles sp.]
YFCSGEWWNFTPALTVRANNNPRHQIPLPNQQKEGNHQSQPKGIPKESIVSRAGITPCHTLI